MAIAAVSHIRLVGLRSQENKIMDVLASHGAFEVRKTDDLTVKLERGGGNDVHSLKVKQDKVSFALSFLKARRSAMEIMLEKNKRDAAKGLCDKYDYTLARDKFSDARTLITHADFSDARAKEFDLLGVCDALKDISFEIVDTSSHITELASAARDYEPYTDFSVPLSKLERSGNIVISLYASHSFLPVDAALEEYGCAYEVRRGKSGMTVLAVCKAGDAESIDKALGALGFSACPFRDDCTAADKIAAFDAESDDARRKLYELTKKALGYEKHVLELRILYDVLELEIERAYADEGFLKTNSAFVLEGWLPEDCADRTVAELEEIAPGVFVQLLAPEERDEPPTLVRNNKVVEPYEQITNMYSAPKYREIDPNPIMAVFYFVFFGLMIGDAAYGVILALAGLILGMSKKFDKGVKSVMLLVGMGGISAIVWGILFGGYFAIDFGETDIALWFNPIDDPMTMLLLSVALGCIQMTVGYIIKFIKLCIDGKPFDAICDAGSIILLFGALGCLACSLLIEGAPGGLKIAAIVLACVGLGLIIIFGGRHNKNVFGKIFGGFKGVYGLVNLLSDVLSYCRLFGLGLASGAIGLAFNTLGSILFDIPGIGYVVGVILLIPLHAFNIGIGVLGAYVHNARLQFLEFYGKFYDGGGRLFEPLGSHTRYVRFE